MNNAFEVFAPVANAYSLDRKVYTVCLSQSPVTFDKFADLRGDYKVGDVVQGLTMSDPRRVKILAIADYVIPACGELVGEALGVSVYHNAAEPGTFCATGEGKSVLRLLKNNDVKMWDNGGPGVEGNTGTYVEWLDGRIVISEHKGEGCGIWKHEFAV